MRAARSRIVDQHGRPYLVVRARYDAAQTTSDNIRHWANADSLSADSSNSAAVRKTLRERARYEVANNGWARSMVETLAHEVIGTGPRVQVETGDQQADDWIEGAFTQWAGSVRLGRKLRTMRKAKAQDGEGVALFTRDATGDGLDLRPIETEQLATPYGVWQKNQVDGIDLDDDGNPVRYHVLLDHPGETAWGIDPQQEINPPPTPEQVVHVFRRDRPGQHRGIPELTPAIPIFAKLRRYNLAVLQACENMASITLALKTKHPETTASNFGPSGDSDTEPDSYETFDTFDLERGLVTVLPEDTDLFQPEPKQPATTHADFVRVNLAEAFACVCMPYSVGAFDSSQENFASGKLTRQGFKRAVLVERELDWNPEVLRIFWAWLAVARFTAPESVRARIRAADTGRWKVLVYWDGVDDIDPEKAARARQVELESGQVSIPAMYSERGCDWQTEQERQAEALGMTLDEYRKRLADKLLGPKPLPPAAPGATNGKAEAAKPNGRLICAAAGLQPGERIECEASPVEWIKAEAADADQPKRFSMTAYTGGAMLVGSYFEPVVVDLAGLKTGGDTIPVLMQHDPSRIVGHGEPTVMAQTIKIAGVVSGGGDAAQEVVMAARNGFPWKASVGVYPSKVEFVKAGDAGKANGRSFQGPVNIVRAGTLEEISFVPIAADRKTSVTVAATAAQHRENRMEPKFQEWLKAAGFENPEALTEPQLKPLKAQFDAEEAVRKTPPPLPKPDKGDTASPVDAIRAEVKAETDRIAAVRKCFGGKFPEIEAACLAEGKTIQEAENAMLKAQLAALPKAPHVHGAGHPPVTGEVIQAALSTALRLPDVEKQFKPEVLEAADKHFRREIGLQELLCLAARANGWDGQQFRKADLKEILSYAFPPAYVRAANAATAFSLSGILSNTANKSILAAFNAVETTWRSVTAIGSVTDFKQVTRYRMTGDASFEKLAPSGLITHGTLDEESFTAQADTYARMYVLDRRDIINDDLGALDTLAAKLGRGAALKLNNVFWTEFINNSTVYTTARKNLLEGTAYALTATDPVAALAAAEQLFLDQTDPDGHPLAITPALLLVPTALWAYAREVMVSTQITTGGGSSQKRQPTTNIFAGRFTPLVSAYLSNTSYTGYSSTGWYLLANPADLAVIEVSFLNGQQSPTIESADADFNTLGVQYRGWWDFGVDAMDYRGGVKVTGVAAA